MGARQNSRTVPTVSTPWCTQSVYPLPLNAGKIYEYAGIPPMKEQVMLYDKGEGILKM